MVEIPEADFYHLKLIFTIGGIRILTRKNRKAGGNLRELMIQNEAKRKREEFMLKHAREIANEHGLHALTLPLLAERSGYSKPTVYKYFPTQEDLIVAMATQSTAIRVSYYEKALRFQGRPREKLSVIGFLNFGPLHFYLREILDVHVNRLNHKASPERQRELYKNEKRVSEILIEIIREAVEIGDLTLRGDMDECQILIILQSITLGGYVLRESDSEVYETWFDRNRLWPNDAGPILLDIFGWHPLSSEWDYRATRKRFYQEVFPELLSDVGGGERSAKNIS